MITTYGSRDRSVLGLTDDQSFPLLLSPSTISVKFFQPSIDTRLFFHERSIGSGALARTSFGRKSGRSKWCLFLHVDLTFEQLLYLSSSLGSGAITRTSRRIAAQILEEVLLLARRVKRIDMEVVLFLHVHHRLRRIRGGASACTSDSNSQLRKKRFPFV